jgi:uncharacterized membrane protein YhaH (DUF805 family)
MAKVVMSSNDTRYGAAPRGVDLLLQPATRRRVVHRRDPLSEERSVNWYLEVLNKYAVFEGRARRMEYWMFNLISFIVSIAVGLGVGFVGALMGLDRNVIMLLSFAYFVAVLIPSLAVSVRRMHDTGRSGWWLLIIVVPLLGAIVLLVFSVQDSEQGTNAYGRNPKTAFA